MSADMLDSGCMLPRRFWLVRRHGNGIAAEGVVWSGGQVALHASARPARISLWASLNDMLAVYGGAAAVEWVDESDDLHSECVEYYDDAVWIH